MNNYAHNVEQYYMGEIYTIHPILGTIAISEKLGWTNKHMDKQLHKAIYRGWCPPYTPKNRKLVQKQKFQKLL